MAITRPDTGAGPKEQRTFQFRPGIVETVWPVRITVPDLRAACAEVERLGCGPLWLADTSATTSFETSCIAVGGIELARLKKNGVLRIVAVIPSAAVRMA